MRHKQLLAGDVLASQGEPTETMYFLLSGSVKAYRAKDEAWTTDVPSSCLRSHTTLVNDFAMFGRRRSEVTMRCAERCVALSLTRDAYEKAVSSEQLARQ